MLYLKGKLCSLWPDKLLEVVKYDLYQFTTYLTVSEVLPLYDPPIRVRPSFDETWKKGLSEFIKLLMSVVIVGACYQLKSCQQSETQLTTLGSPGLCPRTRDSSEGSLGPRSPWRPRSHRSANQRSVLWGLTNQRSETVLTSRPPESWCGVQSDAVLSGVAATGWHNQAVTWEFVILRVWPMRGWHQCQWEGRQVTVPVSPSWVWL